MFMAQMRTKHVILITALICAAVNPGFCSNDFAAKATFDKAAKEHIEEIATGKAVYEINMGGTVDGFNSANYYDTYARCKRVESKFEPNKYLVIENIGQTDIINPRIVINGRRNWYSADDILASLLKPGMTDVDKAMAIFNFSVSIDVQCHDNDRRIGPLYPETKTHPSRNTFKERANPVRAANCYYCSGCQFGSSNLVILYRHAGLIARAIWMSELDKYDHHCVVEVWYDDAWHLFDPDERAFFLDKDNTTIASYEQLHKNIPLVERTHTGGFASLGQRSESKYFAKYYPPSVMSVEQWLCTMDMTLRPGEKFIRRWDNIPKYCHGLNKRDYKGRLVPYQLANGKIIYQPKFTHELFQRGIVSAYNIKQVDSKLASPKLHPESLETSAKIIYKVTSPYPIVGGVIGAKFFRKTTDDTCRIYISSHDSDWIEVFSAEDVGQIEKYVSIDKALNVLLRPAIYEYYVKFDFKAKATPSDVAMIEAYIETDVQIAATSLPALSIGTNRVAYSDDSAADSRVRIAHGWEESSVSKPPLAPAGPIYPADGSKISLTSLKSFTWAGTAKTDDNKIVDYHIQISPRADMLHTVSPNFDRIIFSEKPQWLLPQGWLIEGRGYYWRVRAKNQWGLWSNWSKSWSFNLKTRN